MSGAYKTLEINQPKISYFKKDQKIFYGYRKRLKRLKKSEDNTLWLDEMVNESEENRSLFRIAVYLILLMLLIIIVVVI